MKKYANGGILLRKSDDRHYPPPVTPVTFVVFPGNIGSHC